MDLRLRDASALAIGAHPDDIEFGCFASLSAAARKSILVLSKGDAGGDPDRRVFEATSSAALIDAELMICDHPDTRLSVADLVPDIEAAVARSRPDIIFTMSEEDVHQDHKAVAMATLIALRDYTGCVLAYGTPSSVERMRPQVTTQVTEDAMQLKLKALSSHESQGGRLYMQQDFLVAIARYWAAMTRSQMQYAESFQLVKWNSLMT